MDLISAAEHLATINRVMVTYQPERCLLATDKFSACGSCVEMCPVQAIRPGSPPGMVNETCVDCLACLPACPTGAFYAEDDLKNILKCLTRVKRFPVEILCSKNPNVEFAVDTAAIAIRTNKCLASVGPGGILAMASLGINRITLRTETCQDCPLGQLSYQIERQVGQANQILQILEQPEIRQCAIKDDLLPAPERVVWDAKNPPLTRRDLFQMITMNGDTALAHLLDIEHQSDVRQPGLDHRRMVMAIKRLAGEAAAFSARLHDLPFAKIQVAPACTACSACVRSCPNAALELVQDAEQQRYWLLFKPAACNGCEICQHVCGPQAIKVDHSPQFMDIFGKHERALLSRGELVRCSRCNQLFADTGKKQLCPVCEYRRSNPFGSVAPRR